MLCSHAAKSFDKFNFKNRTAVVTGGAQGFGLDVAKRFLDSDFIRSFHFCTVKL